MERPQSACMSACIWPSDICIVFEYVQRTYQGVDSASRQRGNTGVYVCICSAYVCTFVFIYVHLNLQMQICEREREEGEG